MAMHKSLIPDCMSSTEHWIAELTRFILRGMGITDEAIARCYHPQNIVTDPIEDATLTRLTPTRHTKEHLKAATSLA